MFSVEQEFQKLVENGWLTTAEKEKYLNDENILSCIYSCTSPKQENIFNALKMVPYNDLKAVILGQDPYPNPNHAHGLAFSSKDTVTPESLKNIFRAIDSVYDSFLYKNANNDLTNWAKQGVLLLNTGLTFEKYTDETFDKKEQLKRQQILQKNHMKIWKSFINDILKKILLINNRPVVMFLWGNSAHNIVFKNIKNKEFQTELHSRKPVIIPNSSVMLFQTAHPSPLSVNRGGDFLTTTKLHLIEADKFLGENKICWTSITSNKS